MKSRNRYIYWNRLISVIFNYINANLITSKAATLASGQSLGLPYSVVRFSSGKFYNADLNAAYNIGARYYIRFLMDFLRARLSSEDFGALSAKVPQCSVRSGCVLSDLINLWGVACSSELAREAV